MDGWGLHSAPIRSLSSIDTRVRSFDSLPWISARGETPAISNRQLSHACALSNLPRGSPTSLFTSAIPVSRTPLQKSTNPRKTTGSGQTNRKKMASETSEVEMMNSRLAHALKSRNDAVRNQITAATCESIHGVGTRISTELAPTVGRIRSVNISTIESVRVWQEKLAMMVEALSEVDECASLASVTMSLDDSA